MAPIEVLSSPRPVSTIEELGPEFYDAVTPADFPEDRLRYWNAPLVNEMGWTEKFVPDETKKACFHAFKPLPGSLARPLALRYHGHQFRHYNPDLGDGRGFLYAQIEWKDKLWDFGTKGSGQTPYSRRGDGRLTLKGAFREALATEMLETLGVNTSRTFSFFETGEPLHRSDEPSPTRSAVLTRFSHSHIRLGTFQRLAAFQKKEEMQVLLRYLARHLLPELDQDWGIDLLAARTLRNVSERLAHLAAQWTVAGFVHGVLNTDNLNVTGESFDYGPYRFLPRYDPEFTAAYFDTNGLYSFGRQPGAVQWAVARFGDSLKLVAPGLPREDILKDFGDVFADSLAVLFCHRLNLRFDGYERAAELLRHFLHFQETRETGYEQTFFDCFRREKDAGVFERSPQAEAYETNEGKALRNALESFETDSVVRANHPWARAEKPLTLLIDEIEALWAPISSHDDWEGFERKLSQIRSQRGLFRYLDVTPDHFDAEISGARGAR